MPMQEAYENKLKEGMHTLAQEVAPSHEMFDSVIREASKKKAASFSNINKFAAAACFIAIVFIAVSFSSPVNALVNKMMYLIVRDGSKYNIVETPYDESKLQTVTAKMSSDAKNVLGKTIKLPRQIKIGNSTFKAGDYIVCTNDSTGEKYISLEYLSNEIKTATQLKTTLNYILIDIGKSNQLLAAGDNIKEVKQGDMTFSWAENPYTDRQQITDKPSEVKVYHSLAWEQDGLYYRLSPGEGFDMSTEAALEAQAAVSISSK